MAKYKKLALLSLALLLLVGIFRFVPVYSKSGVLTGTSSTCIAYAKAQPRHYRIIPNGISGFRSNERNLQVEGASIPCAEPVSLRLYLW